MQAPVQQIFDEVLAFVREQFSVSSDTALDVDTHLFRRGVVDSIGILLLVRFIEERYQVAIEPAELVLENFQSAAAIGAFVARKRQA